MAGSINKFNGVTIGAELNGVTMGASIDGVDIASSDSISVAPTYDVLEQSGGTASTYVTSSGAWTASIEWDTNSLISSWDSSGGDGEWADVVCDSNGDEAVGDIRIKYMVGTAFDYFDICVSGTGEECG